MPVIELPKEIFEKLELYLPAGTETTITDKVRYGLGLIKKAKLAHEDAMALLGHTRNDGALLNYLGEEK